MKQGNTKHIIVMVVVALIVGGIGFYLGRSISPKGGASFTGAGARNGMMGGAGGAANFRARAGGGIISGEILSKDAMSVTVKLPNGGSQTALFSASTTILKSTTGTADDLAVGKQISVTGTANADGSITAQSIQVRDQNIVRQNNG